MSKKILKTEPKSSDEVGPYKFGEFLGEGAFSVVRVCAKEGSDEKLACKIVSKERLNTPKLLDRFEVEIRVNQQIHHPGIVQMMDLLCDKNNYYVIMEICKHGDLINYINKKGKIKENEAAKIFHQILETMNYLHFMGIAHRDLKPENILIDEEEKVKIIDFGLSRFIPSNNLMSTPCGSPSYASPECICGKPYDGKTNDVWGCGIILYQMLTGKLPWTKKAQGQMFQQILKGEYKIPSHVSKDAKKLIKGLLTVDYSKRITISDALTSKWFKKMQDFYDTTKQKGYVSMRQVDLYFGKDIKNIKIPEDIDLTSSTTNIELDKYIQMSGVVEKYKRRKKRSKKNYRDSQMIDLEEMKRHKRKHGRHRDTTVHKSKKDKKNSELADQENVNNGEISTLDNNENQEVASTSISHQLQVTNADELAQIPNETNINTTEEEQLNERIVGTEEETKTEKETESEIKPETENEGENEAKQETEAETEISAEKIEQKEEEERNENKNNGFLSSLVDDENTTMSPTPVSPLALQPNCKVKVDLPNIIKSINSENNFYGSRLLDSGGGVGVGGIFNGKTLNRSNTENKYNSSIGLGSLSSLLSSGADIPDGFQVSTENPDKPKPMPLPRKRSTTGGVGSTEIKNGPPSGSNGSSSKRSGARIVSKLESSLKTKQNKSFVISKNSTQQTGKVHQFQTIRELSDDENEGHDE